MAPVDVVAVLRVDDLDRAIAFYGELGFRESFRWGDPAMYGGMTMGEPTPHANSHLHLNVSTEDPGKGEIYVSVDEVDGLYERLKASGVEIAVDLRDQPYGMRDFSVRDPAGNFVTLGQPLPAA